MSYALSTASIFNMRGTNPLIQAIAKRAIQITKIDFGIPSTGGLRERFEQKELFDAGKSKCDGTFKESAHQHGQALDFFAWVDGKVSYDEGHMAQVAAAFLQSAMEMGVLLQWGGLWKNFVDMPHVQLIDPAK